MFNFECLRQFEIGDLSAILRQVCNNDTKNKIYNFAFVVY